MRYSVKMVYAIRLKQACLHSPRQYEIKSTVKLSQLHSIMKQEHPSPIRSVQTLYTPHLFRPWLNFAQSQYGSLGPYDNDGFVVISYPHNNIRTTSIAVFIANDPL